MNTKTGWIVLSTLTLAIVIAFIALFVIPSPQEGTSEPFVSENVKVSAPLSSAVVSKTFAVAGEARGPWFFEASFPVEVHDPSGRIVGHGIAQANGEWMTEDFVSFSATVTVADYSGSATLALKKDNPSGLPEHDDSVEFPIVVR